MDGGSLDSALNRIDGALARLEQTAGNLAIQDSTLPERHETLKASVSLALEQIDTLIAGQDE